MKHRRRSRSVGMDIALVHQWQAYADRFAKTLGRAAAMKGFCQILDDDDPKAVAYAAIALAHIASSKECRACLDGTW